MIQFHLYPRGRGIAEIRAFIDKEYGDPYDWSAILEYDCNDPTKAEVRLSQTVPTKTIRKELIFMLTQIGLKAVWYRRGDGRIIDISNKTKTVKKVDNITNFKTIIEDQARGLDYEI